MVKMNNNDNENIGFLLRNERQKRDISIRALAKKADVSPAIISRIEKGHTSPSFATLKKILDVFHLNFAEFFKAADNVPKSPVIKKSKIKRLDGLGEKLKVFLINAGVSKDIQLFLEEYEPGGSFGSDMLTHKSVEAGICIKGKLALELGGETYSISEGDGWCFDSNIPHRFSNPSDKKAVLVTANTPAVF